MEVLGRVFARQFVAAADMAADEAEPQVNPLSAGLEARLASLRVLGSTLRTYSKCAQPEGIGKSSSRVALERLFFHSRSATARAATPDNGARPG